MHRSSKYTMLAYCPRKIWGPHGKWGKEGNKWGILSALSYTYAKTTPLYPT